MANASTARGLVPYRLFDGSPWNGAANVYYVPAAYATALYIGDPVTTIAGSNDANGVPAVTLAAATTGLVLGSVVGIVNYGSPMITVTQNLPIYRQASVATYILVADDPRLMFWVQDDGTGSGWANWSSKNTNLVSGSGSTVTGYSGWTISGSSIATTSTLLMRVLRLFDTPDAVSNAQPPSANAKWLVKINKHALADSTAGTA